MRPRLLTTFIIPTIGRDTLQRAIDSIPTKDADYYVGKDNGGIGPSHIRNKLIQHTDTEWVSMLDDDDTVTPDYVERLQEEIAAHPDADVIIFREYFLWGQVIPQQPVVSWGNVGISFSVKREVALEYPFKSERYEDFEFLHRLERAGKKIVFSNYLTYKARH